MYYSDKTPLYQLHAMHFQHRKLHGMNTKTFFSFLKLYFSTPTRFFNDTELKNSPKHKIEAKQNVFSLTINKCDHPDVGTYRVQVDNGIDHTEQTAKLNVGGMPHSFSSPLFHSLLLQ
jgi:hypothetical protein